jgi:diguanylate cyclase (GGDEF)-like protein
LVEAELMRSGIKRGIGSRIAALVALSMFGSVMAVTLILIGMQINSAVFAKKEDMRSTAIVFASTIANHIRARDSQAANNSLRAIARLPQILHVRASDQNGAQIAALGNATILESDIVLDNRSNLSIVTKGILPVSVDIMQSGETIGSLLLIADISSIRLQLLWTLATSFAAAIASSIFGLMIAMPIQRRIATPIQNLTQAMRHVIKARDYKTKVVHVANDETGELVTTFNKMISEIEFRDSALERLAYSDPLTGLSNRQHFQKLLGETLATISGNETIAALYLLDLDEFKQINDAFGHTMGDALLMNIAALLKEETQDAVHLARLGGDEFVILAKNVTSQADAQDKLAPFLAALIRPLKLLDQEVHISTSVGISLIPNDGSTASTLMRRADLALYAAKHAGPGNVRFYETAMDRVMREQTEIGQSLRYAIERNEFETYYQPQLDLASNTVLGFEALLRWKHPERGFVSPAVFIPIAETTGQIGPIGNWVLRDACKTLRAWLDAGLPPREISVNVSAAQMLQVDFIDSVISALQDNNLPHNLLCLELTESLFIGKSVGKIQRLLEEMKRYEITLALDDFGTGYSSLSYLEILPFDKVKIDRAFVSGIEKDQVKRNVLKGIIDLCHNLDMKVVAEGAEEQGELAILRSMGADWVQGYILAKPVPANIAHETAKSIETTQDDQFKAA